MSSRGHSEACAEARKTTPQQCKCQCDGQFHGGPHTHRAKALVWELGDRRRYSKGRVATTKTALARVDPGRGEGLLYRRRASDYLVTGSVDVLIRTSRPEADELSELIREVVEPFAKAIVDAGLSPADEKSAKDFINGAHLLCSLCVTLLEIDKALEELSDELADTIVDAVLSTAESRPRASILTAAARVALRTALAKALGPLRVALLPVEPTTLRLLGILFCPDISEHPEVGELCVKPLSEDILSDNVTEWVGRRFAAPVPSI